MFAGMSALAGRLQMREEINSMFPHLTSAGAGSCARIHSHPWDRMMPSNQHQLTPPASATMCCAAHPMLLQFGIVYGQVGGTTCWAL
jgi:hypothetical protein